MAKIRISDTLYIRVWDGERTAGKGLDIIDPTSNDGAASVFAAELPDLLDRLQEAAEAMGIETESDKEIAQLRTQLAGCSVAALGGTSEEVVAKPGSYGWSPAYTDVLNLRFKFEAAGQLLESAEKRLDAAGVVQAELVKALRLAVEYMTTIACDPNHLVLTECRQALAKAER